jgi:hypothetical protein
MRIKKFNENIFNSIVNRRIEECLNSIGMSFEMECKDKEAAKQDLIAFVEKHYAKINQESNNNGEFYF